MATPHLQIRETEYLIVGAGAAGCAFGFLMKQAGADVLLLEMQNPQQRVKLCAGILENRAETAFCGIFGQTVDEAGLAPVRIETMCHVWCAAITDRTAAARLSGAGSSCSSGSK